MSEKNISTYEDVKGLIFITNYISQIFFPSESKLTDSHYLEISVFIKELKRSMSKSTVQRIFNFTKKPVPISLTSMDNITYWCFGGDYYNFKEFLKEHASEIEKENILSQKESDALLSKINQDKNRPTATNSKMITLHGKDMQIDLGEGYIEKLIDVIKHSVGGIINDELSHSPKNQVILHPNNRINQRLMQKEERRQENIDSIISKATEFARMKESKNGEVDQDWVDDFFEVSQDTSNENMQYLWAKILAKEVDKPGTFSRRAVNALKLMNFDEAKIFSLLCNCLWVLYPGETRSDRILIKNSDSNGFYSDSTWGFDGTILRHLEDLGLIHETFFTLEKYESYKISFFGEEHELSTSDEFFEVEMVRLSTIGAEIYDVVMTEKNIEYYQFTLKYLDHMKLLKK